MEVFQVEAKPHFTRLPKLLFTRAWVTTMMSMNSSLDESELRGLALSALQLVDATQKVAMLRDDTLSTHNINTAKIIPEPSVALPGRPALPELISPLLVPRRKMGTPEGRLALAHSIAHIEFNAVNLALDAIWRFPNMPRSYYTDWLQVAREEAQHFALLRGYLQKHGADYGSFPAHNGLWDMVQATRHDVLTRMALVPRLLEARGLDATPQVSAKFAQFGDTDMVTILALILREEIGHVAIGNRWFAWCCNERSAEPISTFKRLAIEHNAPKLRPPFNLSARRAAGFSEEELAGL
jgi:uncharacterized ferritin-like protein (DUF455 family)